MENLEEKVLILEKELLNPQQQIVKSENKAVMIKEKMTELELLEENTKLRRRSFKEKIEFIATLITAITLICVFTFGMIVLIKLPINSPSVVGAAYIEGQIDAVEGSNLVKTINNQAIVGSGNIEVGMPTIFYSQTSLTVDGANGNYFLIELSANASFSLSNIVAGTQYYFRIKNTSGSAITITLPNTADIKASATFTVGASNKHKEVAMIFDGTKRTWQISEELT
jgi:hypothetical protein